MIKIMKELKCIEKIINIYIKDLEIASCWIEEFISKISEVSEALEIMKMMIHIMIISSIYLYIKCLKIVIGEEAFKD